jgi:hypothetical protein
MKQVFDIMETINETILEHLDHTGFRTEAIAISVGLLAIVTLRRVAIGLSGISAMLRSS